MRWAVVGDTGLFGSEMAKLLEERGEELQRFNRSNIDLEQSAETIAASIGTTDVIVNAIGYTQVDNAENEPKRANDVNAFYAGKLANVAAMVGSKYFYVSTDYVFDGAASSPYSVGAKTNAQNVYGKSKELGERLIAESRAKYTIFRTSWLYGANGNNFARTIARQLLAAGTAKIVNDQIGVPTWTRDVAEVLYQHGRGDFDERVVHAVASGRASWFDFALEIVVELPEMDKYSIIPVSTGEIISGAKRPAFSALDNSETKGPIIGDWRERWKVAAPYVLEDLLSH